MGITIETLGFCLASSSSEEIRGRSGAVRSRAVLRRFSNTSVEGTWINKKNIEKSGLFKFDGDAYVLEIYPIAICTALSAVQIKTSLRVNFSASMQFFREPASVALISQPLAHRCFCRRSEK